MADSLCVDVPVSGMREDMRTWSMSTLGTKGGIMTMVKKWR
jgi:hypothetical protein